MKVAASLIYLSAGIAMATSAHGAEWLLLGNDPLVPGAEIFLLADGIQDFGDGNFRAVTLTVHPVTVRGVDLPGPNGELVYALYPHRSVASFDLYDCRRRMIANLQTIYFSSTRPREPDIHARSVVPTLQRPESLTSPRITGKLFRAGEYIPMLDSFDDDDMSFGGGVGKMGPHGRDVSTGEVVERDGRRVRSPNTPIGGAMAGRESPAWAPKWAANQCLPPIDRQPDSC